MLILQIHDDKTATIITDLAGSQPRVPLSSFSAEALAALAVVRGECERVHGEAEETRVAYAREIAAELVRVEPDAEARKALVEAKSE